MCAICEPPGHTSAPSLLPSSRYCGECSTANILMRSHAKNYQFCAHLASGSFQLKSFILFLTFFALSSSVWVHKHTYMYSGRSQIRKTLPAILSAIVRHVDKVHQHLSTGFDKRTCEFHRPSLAVTVRGCWPNSSDRTNVIISLDMNQDNLKVVLRIHGRAVSTQFGFFLGRIHFYRQAFCFLASLINDTER